MVNPNHLESNNRFTHTDVLIAFFAFLGTPKFWGVEGDPERPRWIEPGQSRTFFSRHFQTYNEFVGITPGHEIVGSIVEGDSDTLATRGLTMGDRVTVEQIIPWWAIILLCFEREGLVA